MSSDRPGPSGSQEACFSGVTNEDIYNAYCTLLEKVKGEDRRISVKDVHMYMSEKFDCFAKSCANPCEHLTTRPWSTMIDHGPNMVDHHLVSVMTIIADHGQTIKHGHF